MKIIYSAIAFLFFAVSFAQTSFKKDSVIAFQKQINKEYADPKESPLPPNELKKFKSLDFYPIDPAFFVNAKFVRTPNEKPFAMPTSGTRKPMYVKYAEVHFSLSGKPFKLNVYQNIDLIKKPGMEDYLFLPFTDLTCGVESYGGGRYLDLRIPKKDSIVLDFNKAYNPYCAYSHNFSCPIPPQENDLKIEVKAGVKKFHD